MEYLPNNVIFGMDNQRRACVMRMVLTIYNNECIIRVLINLTLLMLVTMLSYLILQ